MDEVIFLAHPEVPSTRKLTPKQWELLDMVCRSNGGGIHINHHPKSTVKALMDRHLIQGKANHAYRFVHTADGFRLWKKGPEA